MDGTDNCFAPIQMSSVAEHLERALKGSALEGVGVSEKYSSSSAESLLIEGGDFWAHVN